MKVIFTFFAILICITAYSQKEGIGNLDSHQFIKKIDSNKVYFKNNNRISTSKHIAIQLLDSIYNFNSFIRYDSLFIKSINRSYECTNNEFHIVYFLKDGNINLKNNIYLYGQPVNILVDDTAKGKDATKWIHNDNINEARIIENNSISTQRAFQMLDSMYNFKSFIDYDTISIQWEMQYSLCTDWEVNYNIYFLKNNLRNLNYHIFLKGNYSIWIHDVEENGVEVAKWMYHENIELATVIKDKVEVKNDALQYVFEDLSNEKKIHLKNPNKFISYFKSGRSNNKAASGAFQIKFNPKEVYGIEVDSLKMWELTKALLDFDDRTYSLKKAETKGNSVFFDLHYKGVKLDRWKQWQFSKTSDKHHNVDVDRYARGSKWLNISGWFPLLNLKPTQLIRKKKALKIAKELYSDYIENAQTKYTEDWPAKPVAKLKLQIRCVIDNLSEGYFRQYKYIYIYKIEFNENKKKSRFIELNAKTGEIIYNSFTYNQVKW